MCSGPSLAGADGSAELLTREEPRSSVLPTQKPSDVAPLWTTSERSRGGRRRAT
jgi:hypothetical protein